VVLTGSHLDTQPTGGKFDGIYGVLAGLEVIEALNAAGVTTTHPIEVGVWCNEEGCRFPMAMMGSAVWSGRLPLATAYELTDGSGRSVRQELERLGIATDRALSRQPVKAALEVHIEQGPVLEQRAKTIGIVSGVQHMSRHEVIVQGQEAHAGPTPMDMRRDPIRVLAEVLPALYAAARERGADARVTIGVIETCVSPWTCGIRILESTRSCAPRSTAWSHRRCSVMGSRAAFAACGKRPESHSMRTVWPRFGPPQATCATSRWRWSAAPAMILAMWRPWHRPP
jgi:hydantoinase/carbamoylase family amidase